MRITCEFKIALISTFGPEIRGLSPYTDSLYQELSSYTFFSIDKIDFSFIYPRSLINSRSKDYKRRSIDKINILNPFSWLFDIAHLDLLHLQYWTFVTLPAYLSIVYRARSLGTPVVITIHNPTAHERIPFTSVAERCLFSAAKKLIVHTNSGKKVLLERGVSADKISVIPHGVEVINERSIDANHQPKKQILFFGNIRAYKGVEILIEAWRKIKKQYPDWNLIISGRTWEGKTFVQKCVACILGTHKLAKRIESEKQRSREQIHFRIGFIEDSELDALIDDSVLAVFPYVKFESQSGAAARACGRGVPALVTNVGGLEDFSVDDRFICRAGNVESLANRIGELINLHASGNWASFEKCQLQKVNEMSWSIVSKLHLDLYSKLVGGK